MARYDRIARIPPPAREQAFPGWMTLRDLEGRERDPELGRRSRLRFLALRPVRRLLREGIDGPDAGSFRQQLDHVRQELERLPARDPERLQLLEYLQEIGARTPMGLVTATLDMGATAEAAGQGTAAEEFYLTGLEVARKHELPQQQVRALRRLARVLRARQDWDGAMGRGREAATLADATADLFQWALATDGMAAVCATRGDRPGARGLLEAIARRGEDGDNDQVRAIAAAGTCALELRARRPEAALNAGSAALDLIEAGDPHRNRLLLDMASAFRHLGLWEAAEGCYRVVSGRATWVEHRAEAEAERAIMAAERGDPAGFRQRRGKILDLLSDPDPQLTALLHLGLGRGCVLAGDMDDAREHLRQAISIARGAALDTVLSRADELLEALEQGTMSPARPREASAATEAGRRIADRTRALLDSEMVPVA